MTTHDGLCIKNYYGNYSVLWWFFISCCIKELRVSPWLNDEWKRERHSAHTFPAVRARLTLTAQKVDLKASLLTLALGK